MNDAAATEYQEAAPGTPCEVCVAIGSEVAAFPNEPTKIVTANDPELGPVEVVVTASGWSFGDDLARAALCPDHGDAHVLEAIRLAFTA